MTNLTDEGLRSGIKEIVHIKRLGCVDPIEDLIFSFAKQVRDAAKKEERERCAKVVEGKEMVGEGYGVLHLGGWNQAIKVAVTAIRQMDGGKSGQVGVHMTHCNQGEYLGGCKYGELNCPALNRSRS